MRFSEAVESLLGKASAGAALAPTSAPKPRSRGVLAWQLRVEKLSLTYHKHGESWCGGYLRSITQVLSPTECILA